MFELPNDGCWTWTHAFPFVFSCLFKTGRLFPLCLDSNPPKRGVYMCPLSIKDGPASNIFVSAAFIVPARGHFSVGSVHDGWWHVISFGLTWGVAATAEIRWVCWYCCNNKVIAQFTLVLKKKWNIRQMLLIMCCEMGRHMLWMFSPTAQKGHCGSSKLATKGTFACS